MKDTAGQTFEITLSSGGATKASRGEGMVGTCKEEGNTAVITRNTGWTTKIAKERDQYKKIPHSPVALYKVTLTLPMASLPLTAYQHGSC